MKRLLLMLGVLVWFVPAAASAHVLITDQTGDYGAVLHIMPGDDPIAGEVSQLFFDISGNDFHTADYDFVLQVQHSDGLIERMPASRVSASGVRAKVTFPTRGVYSLTLIGQSKDLDTELLFTHTQRISRGVGQDVSTERHAWAEAGLVAAIIGGLVILVLCINRRAVLFSYTESAYKKRG